MSCPKCGAPVTPGLRFCKNCWSPVESTSTSSDPIYPEPASPEPHEQRGPLFGVGYNEPAAPASGPLRATHVPPAPLVQQWTAPPPNPAAGKPSTRAIATMIFGILSVVFFCGFPFTMPVDLIGIALGFFELKAIARGERPASGRSIATVGLTICSIILAIKAFLMIVVMN